MLDKFKLDGDIVIVTGGAGLLGSQYCDAIKEIGGTAVSLDIEKNYNHPYYICDITDEAQIAKVVKDLESFTNPVL